ncbi:MAG: site-specific DNA-methyltransferase, partial [Clostridia bacterium]|nr:site-specific DNA-methyltransferase [Clostridia bacterium]
MEKFKVSSKDLIAENVEKLKLLFPETVCDGKIDFEVLKSILGEYVDSNSEKYSFTWNGKSNAAKIAQTPSTGTLLPVKEKSSNWNKSNNIFIEGDNLEVLKLLQKSYNNKIKMIYIDPPYNTGKDFIYKDTYSDSLKSYLELTRQIDDEGNKISTNSEAGGRYHTNWLNMMYPRLRLARNLLRDDGVIFVSIDDNEVHNLRKLCDLVFGENNYVQEIIWEKKFAPQNDAKYFSLNHEHILCYAKSKEQFRRNLLPMTDEQIARYKNIDNDPRGPWQSDNLVVTTYNVKYDYKITKPNGETVSPPNGRCWRVSKEKFNELLTDNRIWFGSDGNGVPRLKRFLFEVQQGRVPISIFPYSEVGHTQEASKDLKELFDGKKVFDFSKPTRLVERLLRLSTDKDSLVLDFFAGSSTTAHAILKLNAEDGGTRRFIMVQLPEMIDEKNEAYKLGYKSICDISIDRIKRAAANI